MAGLILEIVEGQQAGRQVQLQGPVDIGREPNLPLHVDDGQVSRRHARISPQNGQAVVEDLGSTNGTYVNDQPIHSPRQLNPGDRVRVGLTVIELRSPEQVQQRQSGVIAVPQITAVDNQVLQPVPEQQLAEPLPPPPPPPSQEPAQQPAAVAPGVPGFKVQESPAAYVPPEVVDDEEARQSYQAITHLVDTTAKQRRNVAAFGLLATSAIAVALYFGLT